MTAIVIRDIWLAFRAGGGFGMVLGFYLILVLFVPLGVGSDANILTRIAPGILWIGAILSCLLSLERIFQLDYEDGTLDALLTGPVPHAGVAAAKAVSHWITTGLPITLIAAPLGYLLGLQSGLYGWLILSLAFGTPALSFIGTFGAALTVGVKRGGVLLSLLVLPLYVPTLIFGAQTVIRAASGLNPNPTLALTAAISLFAIVIMPWATGLVLRAALR